ncbi:MAG: DsbA family protein [Pyrinomonadaceae bacterium]
MKRSLPFVVIAAVLAAALLSAWYLKRSTNETSLIASSPVPVPGNRGAAKLGAEPSHTLGDMNAPVMLEEFGDFQCPACRSLHTIVKSLKAEFGPRVVIVFREFPLASHAHALTAARAAEAAGLQGKFWEMHDLLYENQKTWHEASDVGSLFDEYASRIGLSLDQFKRDISGETVERRIAADRERGRWIGVNSTPTLFLNGREVPLDSMSEEKLRALITPGISSGGSK